VPVPLSIAKLEQALTTRTASDPTLLVGKRASVAAVLRAGAGGPEVLLMKRRERDGDRWSGHVSFPGGMEARGDADLVATAMRETLEEVGLDLRVTARLIGRLDGRRAMAAGKILPLTITPHVFVATVDAPVTPREEAEACFWLPLAPAAAGELDGTVSYGPMKLPCWTFAGYTVWGLTFQMLGTLLALM
jgi:8-oxo-dGTP pyrophosphatase MutT (NUDIX family)